MKKIKTAAIVVLALMMVSMVIFAGCAKSGIIGKWSYTESQNIEGTELSVSCVIEFKDSKNATISMTLNGAQVMSQDMQYRLDGENIYFSLDGEESPVPFKYDGKTIVGEMDGVRMELKKG